MAEKKEYIERESVFQAIDNLGQLPHSKLVKSTITSVPVADVVEVVHGKWVGIEYDGYADGYSVWDLFECSVCGCEHNGDEDTLTCYCPDCGAKMDGDTEAKNETVF